MYLHSPTSVSSAPVTHRSSPSLALESPTPFPGCKTAHGGKGGSCAHPTTPGAQPLNGAYGAVDVEGTLFVASSYVEGKEGIRALVCVLGEDACDEAGDRGVLTEGDVHWQVEEHGVVVIDVQHTHTHKHLQGQRRGTGSDREHLCLFLPSPSSRKELGTQDGGLLVTVGPCGLTVELSGGTPRSRAEIVRL